VIVNASNTGKDLEWFREHNHGLCEIQDQSDATALIAVQGPHGIALVDRLRRRHARGPDQLQRSPTRCRRRVVHRRADRLYRRGRLRARVRQRRRAAAVGRAGRDSPGACRIGLGARDTLRLEARLPLYGNDLDDDHTRSRRPGLAVKLDREFIGAQALRDRTARLTRQLAGFKIPTKNARSRATATRSSIARSAPRGLGDRHGHQRRPGIVVGGAIGLAYVRSLPPRPARHS